VLFDLRGEIAQKKLHLIKKNSDKNQLDFVREKVVIALKGKI
jgi:hypothetical protein